MPLSSEAPPDRSRSVWWLLGVLLIGAIALIVWRFVGAIVTGIFLYYATRPIHRHVGRYVGQPTVAAGLSLTILSLPAVLVTGYAVSLGLKELDRLVSQPGSEGLFAQISGGISAQTAQYEPLIAAVRRPEELLADPSIVGTITPALDAVVSAGGVLVSVFVTAFISIAVAFYLLRDGSEFSGWARSCFGDPGGSVDAYFAAVDADLRAVFFGTILNAVLTGVIASVIFTLLNVAAPVGGEIPVPALLGLLTGIASLVPVVGMKLVYVPVTLWMAGRAAIQDPAVSPALWFALVFVVVTFVAVDTIPDLIIRPYVSGRTLHVGLVMLAYVLGPLFFGWYGLFLGPLILVLAVHFFRIVLPELLSGAPIRPYAVDPGSLSGSAVDPQRRDEPTNDG